MNKYLEKIAEKTSEKKKGSTFDGAGIGATVGAFTGAKFIKKDIKKAKRARDISDSAKGQARYHYANAAANQKEAIEALRKPELNKRKFVDNSRRIATSMKDGASMTRRSRRADSVKKSRLNRYSGKFGAAIGAGALVGAAAGKALEKKAEKKEPYTRNKEHAKTTAAGAVLGSYVGLNKGVRATTDKVAKRYGKLGEKTTASIPDRYIKRAKALMKNKGLKPKAAMNQAIHADQTRYAKAGNKAILRSAGKGAGKGALIGAGVGVLSSGRSAHIKNMRHVGETARKKAEQEYHQSKKNK